jgi:PPOX class probable FMN-dependent enzyme
MSRSGRRYGQGVSAFTDVITSEEDLRALVPPAPRDRLSVVKEVDVLDEHARAWIAASPLVLVASADADGRCDVSPRGGPAGWVRVLDDHRLALPDAPGNRRADTLRNVIATGRCGLLFLVPGRRDVLRVNGRSCVTRDPATLEGIPGSPVLAVGVEVDEVCFHCAKAQNRSQLWDADSWPDPSSLAPLAETLRAHAARNGRTSPDGEAEAQIEESLRTRMW